jgi:membrane associated rhomboid family serine protease
MFFLLPVQVKNACLRGPRPIANMTLVAANIVLYVLAAGFGWSLGVGRGSGPIAVISYAFAHSSLLHLVVNMWVLWLIGNPVNRRIGNLFYLLAYFATAIALGLICWFFATRPLVGSSGVIFAILLLFMVLMPSALIRIGFLAIVPLTLIIGLFSRPGHWIGWLCRWGSFELGARSALAIAVLLELWGLPWSGWNWINLAHLFGLLCGVAIVLLLPVRITQRRPA